MALPTAIELRRHLAYEVHYLVHAAVRFRAARGKDKVAFQDSALMHARNLLEFTKPKAPTWGWWIADVGGPAPQASATYERWTTLINAKVTHLGPGRLSSPAWPVPENDERLVLLARFTLRRIGRKLLASATDDRVLGMREVTQRGLAYLDLPTASVLGTLAELVDL